jgi:transglutaminase-like putative cysteine protease
VSETKHREIPPAMQIVAVPAAIALGAIGAIAADRVHLPMLLGFAGGALAAALTVLALPSLPTRRATVLLLGIGGLGALRHASYTGPDHSLWLAIWAAATLVALVLVDRADAESAPPLRDGRPLPPRGRETARVVAIIALVVVVAAVLLVPAVTNRLGRHEWPGLTPTSNDFENAASSLVASRSLDMTTRPRLSDKIVFTVDAPRADYWRGETFDLWNGETWTRSDENETAILSQGQSGTTTDVPAAYGDVGATTGIPLTQTFHMETGYDDIVFAAPSARSVESDKALVGRPDGTVAVAGGSSGFGKGAVYTVVSRSMPTTEADLRAAGSEPVPERIAFQYAQEPVATPRVRELAQQVTAASPTSYDKVKALEAWMGAHLHYSLNAPLSPPGVDVVDNFLFSSREGWCEQIASSLVVLARSVGIPARLVTGFVPGQLDELTGRWVVRERDAHAWAEIYFPGIGWQGFDPTASVPLAGDAHQSGSWFDSARRNAVPLAIAVIILVLLISFVPGLLERRRRRRARRATWSARTMHTLERAGRRAGRARAPDETPREYAQALAAHTGNPDLDAVGDTLDTEAFSAHGASADARDAADAVLSSLRP